MTWYRTGTVAVTANNNTVTGSGTQFSANVRTGDAFIGPDGRIYEVTNVASNTVLSIAPNYRGSTATGQQYAIAPVQGYQKRLADRAAELIDQIGDIPGDVEQLQQDVATKAPINSPSFTGTPTAPTPAAGDNSTRLQTTAGALRKIWSSGFLATGFEAPMPTSFDVNTDPSAAYRTGTTVPGTAPFSAPGCMLVLRNSPTGVIRIAGSAVSSTDVYYSYINAQGASEWRQFAFADYAETTASAPNGFLQSNGKIVRSVSSGRFKVDIEDIEPGRAERVLDFRPVWYRSKCNADRPDWGWYGLIAEEVGEIAPQYVHWSYPKKTVQRSQEYEVDIETDEFDSDGKPITRRETKTETWTEEVDDTDAPLQAEGVMYDRLVVPLLWHVKQQRQRIEALETDLAAVQARLAALEAE